MSDTTRIPAQDQGDGQPENLRSLQDERSGSAMTDEGDIAAEEEGSGASAREATRGTPGRQWRDTMDAATPDVKDENESSNESNAGRES